MKITHLRQWLISLLFIAAFGACTDHRIPAVTPGSVSTRLRVKTITQETPNNPTKVSAFKYDGQNRLSLIIAYQLPDSSVAPVENSVYTYDAQNRLTQLKRDIVRRGSASETYTLSYDAAGHVSLNHLPSTFGIGLRYTADNRVSGYGKVVNVPGIQYHGFGTFTYTGNNLTLAMETVEVIRSGGPPIPFINRSPNTTYTFDDKVNPFYGVYIIPAPGVFGPAPISGSFGPYYTYYGGIDNLLNLSQNNVLSAVSVEGPATATTTYIYTYNSANLPTSRTTTMGSAIVETLRFEYENY